MNSASTNILSDNPDLKLGLRDLARDRLLATVAHELRTPLMPIINGAQVLQRRGIEPELVQEPLASSSGRGEHSRDWSKIYWMFRVRRSVPCSCNVVAFRCRRSSNRPFKPWRHISQTPGSVYWLQSPRIPWSCMRTRLGYARRCKTYS